MRAAMQSMCASMCSMYASMHVRARQDTRSRCTRTAPLTRTCPARTHAQRKCTGVFRTREKTLGSFKPLLFVYLPFSIPSPTPSSIPSSITSPTLSCIPSNLCADQRMCHSPWTHTPTRDRDPAATRPDSPDTLAHTDVAPASEETTGASGTRAKRDMPCARDIFAFGKPETLLSATTPAKGMCAWWDGAQAQSAASDAASDAALDVTSDAASDTALDVTSERPCAHGASSSGADPAVWRTLVENAVNGLHHRLLACLLACLLVCLFVLWGFHRRVGTHASDSSSAWGTTLSSRACEPRMLESWLSIRVLESWPSIRGLERHAGKWIYRLVIIRDDPPTHVLTCADVHITPCVC